MGGFSYNIRLNQREFLDVCAVADSILIIEQCLCQQRREHTITQQRPDDCLLSKRRFHC